MERGNGQKAMLCGFIVKHYAPFESETERQRGRLEDADDDLVRRIIRSSSYLNAENGSQHGASRSTCVGLWVVLSGHSPVMGENERVTVFTVCPMTTSSTPSMSPARRDYESLARIFSHMVWLLRVNGEATYRVR